MRVNRVPKIIDKKTLKWYNIYVLVRKIEEKIMIELKYIINPVMGTIIGFGTNFIAVKMLFRPYKPIKIGKFTLPFTPGVIPKRRADIAKALGDTISKELFTNDDIKNIFLSEEIKEKISNGIISGIKKEDSTVKELFLRNIEFQKYENIKNSIEALLAQKIADGLVDIDIASLIVEEGSKVIKDKISGSFFGSFISEDKIKEMAGPIGIEIEKYLKENAKEFIMPYIDREFSDIEEQKIESLMQKLDITDEKLKIVIEKVYTKIVEDKMQNVFEALNISEVIQEKINAMDVKEIERLFMMVMKKELNAIVNLGAVLGLILGLINAFLL